MKCQNCGNETAPDAKFCIKCGSSNIGSDAPNVELQGTQVAPISQPVQQPAQNTVVKNKSKLPLIFILIGVAIIMIGVGGFFAYNHFSNDDDSKNTKTEKTNDKNDKTDDDDKSNENNPSGTGKVEVPTGYQRIGVKDTGFINVPDSWRKVSENVNANSAKIMYVNSEELHFIELEVQNNPKESAKAAANTIAEDEYNIYISEYYKDRGTITPEDIKIDGHPAYLINTYDGHHSDTYRYIVIFDFDSKQYMIKLDSFREDYKELLDTFSIEK